MSSPDTARFGAIVNKRRRELGLSLDDVAASGGPSQVTVSNIEQGATNRPQFGTFSKLDAVLQWKTGSAARAFDGQDPEPLKTDSAHSPRSPRVATAPEFVMVPLRTVGDLLTSAQRIERLASSETAAAELKQASSDLDLHVDRVMRAWIIVQVESRLSTGDDLQNDLMIDLFLKDYLLRASRPASAEDEIELGYLKWLLGTSQQLAPEREQQYESRFKSTRSE